MQKVKIRFAYKTGFRRLWLVLSVIWLLVGCWFHFYDRLTWSDFASYYVIPVAAMYLIGVAFVWVVEGFARADETP